MIFWLCLEETKSGMKYIFLLLFAVSAFAQNTNISVVSAEKLNVVYRGIENPIKIAVPGVESYKINVSAPGIRKAEGEGNYIITPGAGNEVKVIVTYRVKDSVLVEEKVFRIEDLAAPAITINGQYCTNCYYTFSRAELAEAEIGSIVPNCPMFEPAKASRFTLKIPGCDFIQINGSKLNDEAIANLQKAKEGDLIVISDVVAPVKGYPRMFIKTFPIVILLTN